MRVFGQVSTLVIALVSLSAIPATAQTPNITGSNANVINLLAPFLTLNSFPAGQETLTTALERVVQINNNASAWRQSLAISDKNILGSASNDLSRVGLGTYGPGANLAGGLPAQTPVNGITPEQLVGGYGPWLGQIYQNGVANGTSGPLANTVNLLTTAYPFTAGDAGAAKNYFANGAASNPSTTPPDYVPVPAVPPSGFTLPIFNGLPNPTSSVYDIAFGVTNDQPGQDVYGNSRPVQVAPGRINKFDPTALTGLETNPAFPSGHTTYAFTDSILLAMLAPQLYQGMMLRAAQYGESRIVLGVHYPTDIIGGRSLASYELAQALSNPAYVNNTTMTGTAFDLPGLFAAAYPEMQGYLAAQCGDAVAACATSEKNTEGNPFLPSAENQATYRALLTYGLPTLSFAEAPQEAAPVNGPDPSILLATVYGGSTEAALKLAPEGGIYGRLATSTIDQILVNTQIEALAAFYGTDLSYWARLDLYSASGYFDNVTGTLRMAASDLLTRNASIGADGVLYTKGTITGTVTVNAGGMLAGTGTIGGLSALSGGVVAPGNSIGTLSVAGNASFASGSIYQVEINAAGESDLVSATGSATLDGTLQVVADSGIYTPSTRYTVLSAQGGISGQFASATSDFLFLSPVLIYDATSVQARIIRNDVSFARLAQTPNQVQAARAADTLGWSNPAYRALANLTSASAVPAAFNSLSGEAYASSNTVMLEQSIFLRDAVGGRLRQAAGGAAGPATATINGLAPTFWVQGFSSWGRNDGNINAAEVSSDIGGVFGGADVAIGDAWRVGILGGYSRSTLSVSDRNSSASIDNYDLGLYAGGQYGAFGLRGGVSYTWHDGSMSRSVMFPSFYGQNKADFNAGTTQVFGEASYDVALAPATISPYVGLAYVNLSTDGYAETGSATALVGGTGNQDTVFSTLGVRMRADLAAVSNINLATTFGLAWLHAFGDSAPVATQTFTGSVYPFQVTGVPLARDSALVSAGLELPITPNARLSATYTGQFANTATANGFNGALTVRF